MGKVVADVAKYSTAEYGCRCIPIVEEDCVGELVERGCESDEEGRRHDKTVLVHREVMMNTMEKEVSCYADAIVR